MKKRTEMSLDLCMKSVVLDLKLYKMLDVFQGEEQVFSEP